MANEKKKWIQKLRLSTQEKINTAIREFENETGLYVKKINVTRGNNVEGENIAFTELQIIFCE